MFNVVASRSAQISTDRLYIGQARLLQVQCLRAHQSGFTSAAFATSVHFFSSAAVWAASSAGVEGASS